MKVGAFVKERVRKSLIIFCAVFFAVFSTLTYPAYEAKAGPLVGGAVPAGITLGAGAYTLGALGLAAVAGIAGYSEYEKEVNAHAARAWANGTDLAKGSLNMSIEAAKGAGTGVVGLYTDFINYVDKNLASLGQDTWAVKHQDTIINGNIEFKFRSEYSNGGWAFYFQSPDTSKMAFIINGKKSVSYDFSVDRYSATNTNWEVGYTNPTGVIAGLTAAIESRSSLGKVQDEMRQITTFEQAVAYIKTWGVSLHVAGEAEYDDYIGVKRNYEEAWTTMRDAGLVLPVDHSVPLSSIDATPLNYNADTDTYTGIDGGVYTGVPDWAFPQPKLRVGQKDIPTGVYVDTPVLTGNPAYDKPILENPAIPKTTTNVQTGVTIANPDVPITGNPVIPVDPALPGIPDFAKPGSKQITFAPLITSGTAMTNKFPFSIPFDFVKQFQIFNVEPETPVFKVDIPQFLKIGDMSVPFRMNLDLSMFDLIAEIIRWGSIIAFDIGLIFAIRRLMPE